MTGEARDVDKLIEEAEEHCSEYDFGLLEDGSWPKTMRALVAALRASREHEKEAVSLDFSQWQKNVEGGLAEERDQAETRYLAEHRRAVFLYDLLDKIDHAAGDPQHPKHRGETYHDLYERIAGPIARFANASSSDVSWWEQDFDFDAWERDYFGPKVVS